MKIPSEARPLRPLPALIFASRWLQLPLYIGLILAQCVYVVHFLAELMHLLQASLGDGHALDALVASIDEIESLLKTAEIADCFVNQSPYGEPQLGKRDLYPNINSAAIAHHSNDTVVDARTFLNHLLTILNYSDGEHAMLDIAGMLDTELEALRPVVERLESAGLLKLGDA